MIRERESSVTFFKSVSNAVRNYASCGDVAVRRAQGGGGQNSTDPAPSMNLRGLRGRKGYRESPSAYTPDSYNWRFARTEANRPQQGARTPRSGQVPVEPVIHNNQQTLLMGIPAYPMTAPEL